MSFVWKPELLTVGEMVLRNSEPVWLETVPVLAVADGGIILAEVDAAGFERSDAQRR
jgi:hypothetical protein